MALTIKITPEELRDAATILDANRDEILAKVEDIHKKIEEVAANWEGAAQSSFVEGFNEMVPLLSKDFPSIIEGLSAQLRGAADAIEAADEEVSNAFRG